MIFKPVHRKNSLNGYTVRNTQTVTTCMGNCCSPGCRLWCLWLCLFVLSFFPRGVLDEILNLIESVSEGFPFLLL